MPQCKRNHIHYCFALSFLSVLWGGVGRGEEVAFSILIAY